MRSTMRPMTLRVVLYLCFVFCCAAALVWPGYAVLGNRIDPRVLGLPFSFAWNIIWVLASFVALVAFHFTRPKAAMSANDDDVSPT